MKPSHSDALIRLKKKTRGKASAIKNRGSLLLATIKGKLVIIAKQTNQEFVLNQQRDRLI